MATELVLLGTAGGPTPRGPRHAPSQALVVDGSVYVVDCGNAVAHQMRQAELDFGALEAVFVTHHHSDHNADLGTLFLLAWPLLAGRTRIVGPPPTERMVAQFLQMQQVDISVRTDDESRPPLDTFLDPMDIRGPGIVHRDDRVTVTAAVVDHPPIHPAFAYRFDTADRSIVVSGDTRPCQALVELASGADVLVHEVLYPPAIRSLTRGNNGRSLADHLLASHTPVDRVGEVAEAAGVGTLVLSHFVPSHDGVADEVWREHAQAGFSGRVVVGRDLLRL